jgi:sugar phosphate permease
MNKRSSAVIFASFCTVFVGFAVRNSYGILLPEMIPSLMISKKEAGVIYGSFFIAYTLFSPVLGFLADRINIRILLTLFSVVLGIRWSFIFICEHIFDLSNYLDIGPGARNQVAQLTLSADRGRGRQGK